MRSPSPPPAPDPAVTAAAQGGVNRDTAVTQQMMNMTNQQTPWGSLSYDQTGTRSFVDAQGRTVNLPSYTATQSLTEPQQRIFETNQATQGNIANLGLAQSQRLGEHMATPFAFDGEFDRNRVEAALMERMQPQIDRDREAMETRMANQGLRAGSAAYGATRDQFGRMVNDARLGAILSAGDEQSRSIANAINVRNQPINEITALMSGSQVSAPNFMSTPQTGVGGVDYGGIVGQNYAGQMNAYNAQMGQRNAMMGGLFGLAGAGIGML